MQVSQVTRLEPTTADRWWTWWSTITSTSPVVKGTARFEISIWSTPSSEGWTARTPKWRTSPTCWSTSASWNCCSRTIIWNRIFHCWVKFWKKSLFYLTHENNKPNISVLENSLELESYVRTIGPGWAENNETPFLLPNKLDKVGLWKKMHVVSFVEKNIIHPFFC